MPDFIPSMPRYRFPDIVVHGAEATFPSAGAVLADTGVLPATISNRQQVVVSLGGDDSVPTLEIAHRNAANTADIEVSYVGAAGEPGGSGAYFTAKPGERIVVRAKTAGTSAKIYQADLYVWNM